jgi:isopropylmalate/homocitrate/citramalate synthase
VSRLVSDLANVPLQSNKPITGKNAFRHESGMVVAGLVTEPFSGESYSPELVGQKREIAIGKGSGGASIKWKLESLGYKPTEEEIKSTLTMVKAQSSKLGRVLSDSEFAEIIKTTVSKKEMREAGEERR